MPTNKKTKKTKQKAPAAATVPEPYAIVGACDGCGAFCMIGVHPNPNGTFTIYYLVARLGEGVRDAVILPDYPNDFWENATADHNPCAMVSLAEAVTLWVDPAVRRTSTMVADAIPVIRWFEKHGRRPGPHRGEALQPRNLTDEEYQRQVQYQPQGSVPARVAAGTFDMDHHSNMSKYIHSDNGAYLLKTWFLGQGDLAEMGVGPNDPMLQDFEDPLPLQLKMVACPRILERSILMAQHMRLLYTMMGDGEKMELWNKEAKIAMARFVDSGTAVLIAMRTKAVITHDNSLPQQSFFIEHPQDEPFVVLILRGFAASTLVMLGGNTDPSVLAAYMHEVSKEVEDGVDFAYFVTRQRIPHFELNLDSKLAHRIAETLLQEFMAAYGAYSCGQSTSPFTLQDTDILSLIKRRVQSDYESDERIRPHAVALAEATSTLFWDVACMVVHPEDFDSNPSTGRRLRKVNPEPCASRPRPTLSTSQYTLSNLLPDIAEGYGATKSFGVRVSRLSRDRAKHYFTIKVSSSAERSNIVNDLCPRFFTMESVVMKPCPETIDNLMAGDRAYSSNLLRRMATAAPQATFSFLSTLPALADEVCTGMEDALASMDRNQSTSTIKQKWHCVACGKSDERGLMKCSRCKIARYCKYKSTSCPTLRVQCLLTVSKPGSRECQSDNWKIHKKICQPIASANSS